MRKQSPKQSQKVEQGDGRRETRTLKRLAVLFFSSLYISAFTFGGGFVIVTLMKRRFVDSLHWLEEQEMLDLTALAQSAPGPIALNGAILVGWRVAGAAGIAAAALGTVLPPVLILSVVSVCYNAFAENHYVALALRGMRAGVAAVILDVAYGLGAEQVKTRSVFSVLVMAAAFALSFCFRVNVILLILAAAAAGLLRALYERRREARRS